MLKNTTRAAMPRVHLQEERAMAVGSPNLKTALSQWSFPGQMLHAAVPEQGWQNHHGIRES